MNSFARDSILNRNVWTGREEAAADPDWSLLDTTVERHLALRCARYAPAMQKAASNLDPSPVAAYLLDLAKDFNRFYHECRVLQAETPELKRARLALCERVGTLLRRGLAGLGIHAPEEM